MTTIRDIYTCIDTIAPFHTALSFDNPGLLLHGGDGAVTRALLALDVTQAVVAQAIAGSCELIVSHHPLIFEPLRAVDHTMSLYSLIRHDISVISAHTNLDCAVGGVGDALCELLELRDVAPYVTDDESVPLGRVGALPQEMSPRDFAQHVKEALGRERVFGTLGLRAIRRVAVVGGAGGRYWPQARAAGADAYVTSDVGHHAFLDARECGFTLLDAGHFETERPVLEPLRDRLTAQFPDVTFSVAGEQSPIAFF